MLVAEGADLRASLEAAAASIRALASSGSAGGGPLPPATPETVLQVHICTIRMSPSNCWRAVDSASAGHEAAAGHELHAES